MVVVSKLSYADIRPNDYWEDVPHFIKIAHY